MKERPILFSGPMVRAILDGRKTQTRRVLNPQPTIVPVKSNSRYLLDGHGFTAVSKYGVPGDRLWVRETFRDPDTLEFFAYKADVGTHRWRECIDPDNCRWRPSIFLRRRDSRITLDITEVRVQRLQEISEEDAQAEGVEWHDGVKAWRSYDLLGQTPFLEKTAAGSFRTLWDSINAKRGFGWDTNPWIWAITFPQYKGVTP